MVLRMKKFNIFGVHWKIRLLGGFTKNQIEGGQLPQKGDWTVCWFKRGLGKKQVVVFLRRVDNLIHTMRMVQNLKRNLFFVSKMTRIWGILIWALKSLNKMHFCWSLLCKVYNVWPKNVQRSIFHDTEESCKIWKKLTCGLENDMTNLANFHQNT